ncbi:MAG: hypothetical protein GC185_04630 [Alphaproteobacteria bacterium]|nr:hypothetical protein [Alphaproteobacteria bacterium]
MMGLRNLSAILFVFPAITLVYDLIYFWFVKSTFRIRKLKEWGDFAMPDTYKAVSGFMHAHGAAHLWDKLSNLPAPVALGILPLTLYIIFRIMFLINGGKSGGSGGFVYKSRH